MWARNYCIIHNTWLYNVHSWPQTVQDNNWNTSLNIFRFQDINIHCPLWLWSLMWVHVHVLCIPQKCLTHIITTHNKNWQTTHQLWQGSPQHVDDHTVLLNPMEWANPGDDGHGTQYMEDIVDTSHMLTVHMHDEGDQVVQLLQLQDSSSSSSQMLCVYWHCYVKCVNHVNIIESGQYYSALL